MNEEQMELMQKIDSFLEQLKSSAPNMAPKELSAITHELKDWIEQFKNLKNKCYSENLTA